MSLLIRDVKIENPIVVAPMAGVTNLAFLTLLSKYKPGLYFNEMVSDQAINYRNAKTLLMCRTYEHIHPVTFQIFGSELSQLLPAIKYLDKETDCDIIDLNLGCPVNKVTKQGSGSSLMLDEDRTADLVYHLVRAIDKPLTVKMRLGYDLNHINCVSLAQKLEIAGVSAISVHGRTKSQMYTGSADWEWIKKVKESVKIPVFGNGDVDSVEKFFECYRNSGVDGVMIGRGLLKNPWLIGAIKKALETGDYNYSLNDFERLDLLLDHCQNLIELLGEHLAILQMRSHACWGIVGMRYSHQIKLRLVGMTSFSEFVTIINEYKEMLINE